jgi:protein-S-isoprenylcysteine O-methyltransferase Ste14
VTQRPLPGATGGNSRLPSLGPRGEGWFALQLLFIAAIAAAGVFAGSPWGDSIRMLTAVAGGALIVAGLALGFAAIRDLDRSLSPLPRPRETAVLVRHGVYSRLRHPIYAAAILVAVGWSLLTGSWLALALSAGLALVLDLKSRREEIWLRERYPDYAAYATLTRRFVPGIY